MMIRLRTSSTADSLSSEITGKARRHCTLERHARHTSFPWARAVAHLTGGVAQRTGTFASVSAWPLCVPQDGPLAQAQAPFAAVNRTTIAGLPSNFAKSTELGVIEPAPFSPAIISRH